jgi:hypothetical protein
MKECDASRSRKAKAKFAMVADAARRTDLRRMIIYPLGNVPDIPKNAPRTCDLFFDRGTVML